MRPFHWPILAVLLLISGCSKGREYELRGQVLAVDPDRQELTIKHDDIRGFMPGMTMPFKVRDKKLLEGRLPGDLVTATLVVEDADAFLSAVTKTGHAALTGPPPAAPSSRVINPGEEVPDVQVVDQSGTPRRLSEWRGRVLAVTFIYTRCPLPNFCPLMDRHFAAAQKAIKDDAALRGRARLLSVSFDPGFDTPAVLKDHAARAGADPAMWSFVTGDRDAIDRFAGAFGVSIIREDADLKEIVHNLRTAVIDPQGRVVEVFTVNEWTAEELLTSLRRAGA
jgi:protein SCO1/2